MAIFESSTQGTTVTTSVTQVFSTSGLTSPYGVLVVNQGTATIYVGGSTTTANASGGPQLGAGEELYISGAAADLWAITASGSASVVAGLATSPAVQ